jgi:hypothetical protein
MRSLSSPAGFLLGAALCALLSPLFVYIVLALVVPLLLFLTAVVILYPGKRMMDGTPKLSALRQIGTVLVVVIGMTAPFRAMMVLVYRHVPPLLERLDGFLEPGVRAFGSGFVPRLDLTWAVGGLTVILVTGVLDGAWRLLTVRQIEALPTARVRSVALGLAELRGVARPVEANADPGAPLLRSARERRGDSTGFTEEIRPFYLEDETGRILVDPRGAEISAGLGAPGGEAALPRRIFGARIREILLSRRIRSTSGGLSEAVLLPGDEVYVIGTVAVAGRRDPDERGHIDGKVIGPRPGAAGSFRFYDVFFLGDRPEVEVRRYFFSGIRYAIVAAVAMVALCATLSWQANEGRRNMFATYGYVPGQAP